MYVDGLFLKLKSSGLGCFIEDVFVGAFGYADDLALLAPSLDALKAMIHICEEYADAYKILYNPKKSKLMYYNVHPSYDICITLSGSPVEVVTHETYLGNFIGTNIYERDIKSVVSGLYRRANHVRADFGCIDCFTHYKLFSTYCTNFYGSELWNYNRSYIGDVFTAWRVLMRQVFKLPRRAHNFIVNGICESITIRLDRKLLKYLFNMIHSTNITVCTIVDVLLKCKASTFDENYRYLNYKYKLCRDDWSCDLNVLINKIRSYSTISYDERIIVDNVRELCSIRDDIYTTELSKLEIQIIIDALCIE